MVTRYITKKGEATLDNFYGFENKRLIPVSGPKYCFFNGKASEEGILDKPNDFSMMYRLKTCTFCPGETVDVDLVFIPKTKYRVTSLRVAIESGGLYNLKVKSKKKGHSLKSLVNKNMTEEQEFQYMKDAIDNGLGYKFALKLPENLHEDVRQNLQIWTSIRTYMFVPSRISFFSAEAFFYSLFEVFGGGCGDVRNISSLLRDG